MADSLNPRLAVTVGETVYEFDFDAITGRQLGMIETWCGIDGAAFAEGIKSGSHAAAAAAVFVSVDQASGPLSVPQALIAMDLVSIHSPVAFSLAGEDVPAEPEPAKKVRKKAA